MQYIFVYPKHDAYVVMQSGDAKQFDIFPLIDKYFPACFSNDASLMATEEKTKNFEKFINNISYDILNLFREKKSITDVLELIADEYNVNIEKLFCDSSTMLNFAIEKNVIEEMVE